MGKLTVMRFLFGSLFLLTARLVLGQGFGFSDHVYLSPVPSISPTNAVEFINSLGLGITARWMSASLTLSNKVSDWKDETNHFSFFQASSPNQPTNFPNGVFLDSSHYLNCTNPLPVAGGSSLVIFRWNKPGFAQYAALAHDSASGLEVQLAPNIYPLYLMGWGGQYTTPTNILTGFNNSVWAVQNAGLGQSTVTINDIVQNPSGGVYMSWGADVRIGQSHTGSDVYNGYLVEWIFFTNAILSSANLSNLNFYSTNFYSP